MRRSGGGGGARSAPVPARSAPGPAKSAPGPGRSAPGPAKSAPPPGLGKEAIKWIGKGAVRGAGEVLGRKATEKVFDALTPAAPEKKSDPSQQDGQTN